ncbi:hypothetical protein DFJ43DRAFT_1036763 [Lentinula guzmanii]|uniref:Uncharacterized protein n=1 Tax=Lentinula guzmanii TaxID=2804957 RepID=A0AA38JRE4_9AGAR|nr:hypothetical protein DFJ43DRAFT_1036763 [Lentinula guzmanii]
MARLIKSSPEVDVEQKFSNFQQRDATIRAKRRKIGLNSKFDRMVEAMNVTYRSPKKKRQRTRSSSVSSYGVPQTPVDAYDGLQIGALGQEFSVIKMRNGSRSELEAEDRGASQVSQDTRCTSPLPGWLSDTFTTLAQKHPLRLLLPSSMRNANAEIRDVHDASNESEDVFAFKPLPMPAESSNVLQSPIAFRARHIPTETSVSTRLASPPSHFEPFSTPGPASSIRQPSPPRSFMSSTTFPQARPHSPMGYVPSSIQHDGNDLREIDNYEYVFAASNGPSIPQTNVPTPSFAFASSLLASPAFPGQDPNSNTTAGNYVEHDLTAHTVLTLASPQFSKPPILSQVPRLSNGSDNFDLSEDMDHHSEFVSDLASAFTTPGPAYISSVPVYFDTPTDDPSSDPPDSSYDIDYTTINFQWTPFDRKITGSLEYKHPIRPMLPMIPEQEPSIGTEDLGSLPPSSDQLSGDDSNISIPALHGSKSGSDRELPLATSSDSPAVNEEPENARQNIVTNPEGRTLLVDPHPAEVPPSPSPFRFTPPSRTPSFTQAKAMDPADKTLLCRRTSTSSARISNMLTDGQLPAAAASSTSSDRFAKSGYADRGEVKDLDLLKNDLLTTLDKIAPDPPRQNALVHAVEVNSMSETDSIESWSEEQEQELSHLGL